MKKILVVFGTRPEFIKLLPVILSFKSSKKKCKLLVCNTSQHKDLVKPLIDFYNIKIDYNLNVLKKGQSLSQLASKIISKVDLILKKNNLDCIVVQGDTSTTIFSSLAAFYNRIKIFHVEAGLRTYNLNSPWPEELNRQFTSKIASHNFAPTPLSKKNLVNEGYGPRNITITGNTVIDLLLLTLKLIGKKKLIKRKLKSKFSKLSNNKFKILLSVHRRENFGSSIKEIFKAINNLSKKPNIQIIYCIHSNPYVKKAEKKFLKKRENIVCFNSLDYISFVYLMNSVDLIMSDSGGIQEEAPSIGKPHLILREFTERPEAIDQGSAALVKLNETSIVNKFNQIYKNKDVLSKMSKKRNIYGKGNAAKLISEKILNLI